MRLIDADAIEYYPLDDIYNIDVMVAYKESIENMPTVDAEPVRHGRWKPFYSELNLYVCSECGGISVGEMNYCHHCGAQMDNTQSLSEFK